MTSATASQGKMRGQTERGRDPEGGLPFLRWELVFYGLLIAVALSMRLWDLGARAFGYDESLHAYYGFRLAQGFEYQHSPLTHGPFQFHGMAALYFLLGDSDAVSRVLHALFGTALVLLPIFLRGPPWQNGRADYGRDAGLFPHDALLQPIRSQRHPDVGMDTGSCGAPVALPG